MAINANGNNPISVTATDPAGNISAEATQTLVVDTTPPPPEPEPTPEPSCPFTPFQPDTDGDGMPDAVERILGFNLRLKDNDVFGNDMLFVRQLYRDLLWREGDAEGIAYWTGEVGSQSMTRAQVVDFFFNTEEFQASVGTLTRIYEGALGRTPDVCGLDYWMARAAEGQDPAIAAEVILRSEEFIQQYGVLDDTALMGTLYQNMFGRSPTAEEQNAWSTALATGTMPGQVLVDLANSIEYRSLSAKTVMLDLFYVGLLNRAPDADGYAYWQERIAGENTPLTYLDVFFSSSEYHDRFLPAAHAEAQTAAATQAPLILLGQSLDGLDGLLS